MHVFECVRACSCSFVYVCVNLSKDHYHKSNHIIEATAANHEIMVEAQETEARMRELQLIKTNKAYQAARRKSAFGPSEQNRASEDDTQESNVRAQCNHENL